MTYELLKTAHKLQIHYDCTMTIDQTPRVEHLYPRWPPARLVFDQQHNNSS